jgi:glycosyltransferase involved in cell wall biosynthesis
MSKQRILLTTEGTYPHYHGGVSVWCDQLIRSLSDREFHVLSIVNSPSRQPVFELAPNIKSLIPVAQWGTEEAGTRPEPFSDTYRRYTNHSQAGIEKIFLPAFHAAVGEIFAGASCDAETLGSALAVMHAYFQDHDYHAAFADTRTWRVFLRHAQSLTLHEATTSLRWLTRFLGILATPLPDVDVVHASMAGLAGLPGVILNRERGTRFILSEHGVYLREVYLSLSRSPYSEGCRRFLMGFYHAVARTNYHAADTITTLGCFNARWQERFGADPQRMVSAPNGVDPSRFRPDGVKAARPTVLTLARIYPLKGITVLLEAAALVRPHVPGLHVRILGEKADAAYFAKCQEIVAKHKLEGCVEFGETKTAEVEYRSAHVYCLPSISEAMPFVILEAMLSGCPVVAADVGNVADVLSGTGLLARPNDPASLAEQLLRLLAGPDAAADREYYAERGLARALHSYTLERSMKKFDQLYTQVPQWKQTYQTV